MTEFSRSFAGDLRRRRTEAGMSLDRLSALVHYSKSQLSKVENGVARPQRDMAIRCDAVLGAGGALAALVPDRPEDRAGSRADRVPAVDRSAAPDDLGGPVPGPGALLSASRDRNTALQFEALFAASRRLGLAVSPTIVLPNVLTQVRAVRTLALAADRQADRTRLLDLAAHGAEYAGWMSQEAGDDAHATTLTRAAAELARAAGDHRLAQFTLVRHADIALYSDDPVETVRLCRLVQEDRHGSRRVAGLAAQREAQGWALLQDRDGWRRASDRAAELLGPPTEEDGPVLGSASVPDPSGLVTGWCLYDLGLAEEAAEMLDLAIPRIPPEAQRARVRFGVRQALAHAAAGEVDTACLLVRELLDAVGAVDSATIRADLRRLDATLTRWARRPAVADVRGSLAEAMAATGW